VYDCYNPGLWYICTWLYVYHVESLRGTRLGIVDDDNSSDKSFQDAIDDVFP
jgi:hypothetical protein